MHLCGTIGNEGDLVPSCSGPGRYTPESTVILSLHILGVYPDCHFPSVLWNLHSEDIGSPAPFICLAARITDVPTSF